MIRAFVLAFTMRSGGRQPDKNISIGEDDPDRRGAQNQAGPPEDLAGLGWRLKRYEAGDAQL